MPYVLFRVLREDPPGADRSEGRPRNGFPGRGSDRAPVLVEISVMKTPVAGPAAPVVIDRPQTDETVGLGHGWNVVVWNDPVNLMSYVVLVFRRLFGYSEEKATRLMLEVHHQGRSIVNTAPRERAEMDCYALHRHGLWATLEQA